MKLKCISTGSGPGNCYALIDSKNQILLLDLGTNGKEIKKAVDFNIRAIVGAVVTHTHIDHSKSLAALRRIGIDVATPYENQNHKLINYHFCNYNVTAIPMDDVKKTKWQHTNTDGSECPIFGYVIQHPELHGLLLYITDCCYVKYNFQNVGNIILGVDYQNDLLDLDGEKTQHQLQGHMSIATAKMFVQVNSSDMLQNVIIGHLSEDCADKEYFINEIKSVTNSNVLATYRGMEIELGCPF